MEFEAQALMVTAYTGTVTRLVIHTNVVQRRPAITAVCSETFRVDDLRLA